MIKATISSKGQIAIPKAVRERLNLKAGTEVRIDVQGEPLVMKRLVSGFPDWRTMEGMARGGVDSTGTCRPAGSTVSSRCRLRRTRIADELVECRRDVLHTGQAEQPGRRRRILSPLAVLADPLRPAG